MKKILSGVIVIILVWGCAKKINPSTSQTTSSNNQPVAANTNVNKKTETTTTTTVILPPVENPGTKDTKDEPVKIPDATSVIAGQATYNVKCVRCHELKITNNYTADRWTVILAIMAPRAYLTDAEKANVYAYVKANAKQ